MARRQIGQEVLASVGDPTSRRVSLGRLFELIAWSSLDRHLVGIDVALRASLLGPRPCFALCF